MENSEHLILSTCNRTEFYSHLPIDVSPLTSPDTQPQPVRSSEELLHSSRDALDFYRRIFAVLGDTPPELDDPSHFYVLRQHDAVEHLFRLAGGLESMIVGESQILGQIKSAYTTAQKANTAGQFFHRLFPAAIKLGKRVRTSTGISEGCITPGQAALRLAREVHDGLDGRSVVVIGSGKIAGLTMQALAEEDIGSCVVVNRTEKRAQALADELGVGTFAPWSCLEQEIEKADLVISSTGAVEAILTEEQLRGVQQRRSGRSLAIVDLAVPRDFPAEASGIDGVHVFNIDALNSVIQNNVDRRVRLIPKVEEMIAAELRNFHSHMIYLKVDPVLRHLIQRFEQIRLGVLQQEIEKFPRELHEDLDELTSSLVRKLLHFPIEKLKSLRSMRDLDESEVRFLQRLFLTDPRE